MSASNVVQLKKKPADDSFSTERQAAELPVRAKR